MSSPSPALSELIVELHRLGRGVRNSILERLGPDERAFVLGQLKRIEQRPASSFDALASLSPWLAESLAAARSAETGTLTQATREALLEAERLLPTEVNPKRPLFERLVRRKAAA